MDDPQIRMVDLYGQYLNIKNEVDVAMAEVLTSTAFINGPQVERFATQLASYLDVPHVIPCANGTDALQIAFMALGLKPGDEVIVPAFTYIAPAEAAALLGLVPVVVDVDPHNFNMTFHALEQAWSPKTKAIVPVHLFGQCAPMEPIMEWAKAKGLFVVEDTAQALGAKYLTGQYKNRRAGTIGHIGCTSFFPSKNLGCFGDGGAMMTKDAHLAAQMRMITRHGQRMKYIHEVLGCNSRLDTLQAAILEVKLKYLDQYEAARYRAAQEYTQALRDIDGLACPLEESYSTHVYHQYTLRVLNGWRDELVRHLTSFKIPSAIYYPVSVQKQEAFTSIIRKSGTLFNSEQLCSEVLSLPMHTELTVEIQDRVITQIRNFFNNI
ncbi:MAG: DegT/DnrJ/EryC1/StrS family aminotransferase [Bacteroidales bacterium]|nr:DegT/DnrJ/EryC1/StrS family aminotransferase [Bacteroidales bacterium]